MIAKINDICEVRVLVIKYQIGRTRVKNIPLLARIEIFKKLNLRIWTKSILISFHVTQINNSKQKPQKSVMMVMMIMGNLTTTILSMNLPKQNKYRSIINHFQVANKLYVMTMICSIFMFFNFLKNKIAHVIRNIKTTIRIKVSGRQCFNMSWRYCFKVIDRDPAISSTGLTVLGNCRNKLIEFIPINEIRGVIKPFNLCQSKTPKAKII